MKNAFDEKIIINSLERIRLAKGFHPTEKVGLLSKLFLVYFKNLESFDVTNAGSFVYLNMIEVKEPRKGTGKQVMEIFCSFLDANKLPCRLTVDPHYGTDYDVLQKFYRSFGFENYDIEGVELIREPKG